MDNYSEEIKQISKYNDANLSISRLNESWNLCKSFIRRGKFNSWQTELDNIWMELFPDVMRHEKSKELVERNQRLMRILAKCKLTKQKNNIFFALMKRHCFLREVQDKAGKAGVYVDANEEGFE